VRIKATFDSHKAITWLNSLQKSQIPYATALTLNGLALRAQKYVRANTAKVFTLRNKWTLGSIQVELATKHKPIAILGSRQEYMLQHETGGTFTPKGSKSFSIPLKDAKRNKNQIVPRSKWPVKLKGKKIRIIEGKKGKIMIELRKSSAPKLLWAFERKKTLKPKLNFIKTASAVAAKFSQIEFETAFRRAIAGARQ
jgi:hypothetical protein